MDYRDEWLVSFRLCHISSENLQTIRAHTLWSHGPVNSTLRIQTHTYVCPVRPITRSPVEPIRLFHDRTKNRWGFYLTCRGVDDNGSCISTSTMDYRVRSASTWLVVFRCSQYTVDWYRPSRWRTNHEFSEFLDGSAVLTSERKSGVRDMVNQ
jgi:hypothetical protein